MVAGARGLFCFPGEAAIVCFEAAIEIARNRLQIRHPSGEGKFSFYLTKRLSSSAAILSFLVANLLFFCLLASAIHLEMLLLSGDLGLHSHTKKLLSTRWIYGLLTKREVR